MLLAPADARHDTERAVVVAALDHAYEVADPRPTRVWQDLSLRVVVPRFQCGDERLVLADRHHGVEMREAAGEVLALLGDDAARHGNRALGGLPLLELVELGVDAVLGGLPDDAAVENRDVSSLERILDVTGGKQASRQAF